jgi:hypothetical protein
LYRNTRLPRKTNIKKYFVLTFITFIAEPGRGDLDGLGIVLRNVFFRELPSPI